jgi:hypothetical protein
MTRHNSAALIFDEFEYEPFTENRRWPSGTRKIARDDPPAMPSNAEKALIRAEMADNRAGVAHLAKLKDLKSL